MSLYAIGDLHLHFQSKLPNMTQQKDRLWRNHEEKLAKNCSKLLQPEDMLVLVGDHSWGMNLAECEEDFNYIERLPGRKILTRGNHDMFWDAKKTESLNERFSGRLFFLQGNYAAYGDTALVAAKGYTFEGPFYLDGRGRIVDWDDKAEAHAKKLVKREEERLREGFERAVKDGFRKFIMFLHYPPTNILEKESVFTRMAEEYHASQVIYAHCHGEARFHDSIMGEYHGVEYSLVSGDYLRWMPKKIL